MRGVHRSPIEGPYGSADGLYRLGLFVRGTKEQGPLDFRSKHPEMLGEPVEQLPLCCIGGEVADQFALANLDPELFLVRFHVSHVDPLRRAAYMKDWAGR
jgi:hypothetical protein